MVARILEPRGAARKRRDRGVPPPSIREVALAAPDEAAGWSPGQRVVWAGRRYVVAGRAEGGPARLLPVGT